MIHLNNQKESENDQLNLQLQSEINQQEGNIVQFNLDSNDICQKNQNPQIPLLKNNQNQKIENLQIKNKSNESETQLSKKGSIYESQSKDSFSKFLEQKKNYEQKQRERMECEYKIWKEKKNQNQSNEPLSKQVQDQHNELFLQDNDDQQQNELEPGEQSSYDPNTTNINLEILYNHKLAKRVGKPTDIDQDNIISVCFCCGSPIENEELSLWCKKSDLDFLGTGYPLFYHFLQFCSIVMLLFFLFTGIQSISENQKGEFCKFNSQQNQQNLKKLEEQCNQMFIQTASITNRMQDSPSNTQSALSLAITVLMMGILIFFRQIMIKYEIEYDSKNIEPSDYTIMVIGLPDNESKISIKSFFEKCLNNENLENKVISIQRAFRINKLMNQKKQEQEYLSKLSKAKRNLQRLNSLSAQGVIVKFFQKNIEKNIVFFENKLYSLKFEIYEQERSFGDKESKTLQFANAAFISFEKEEICEKILNHFKLNYFQQIMMRIKKVGHIYQSLENPQKKSIIQVLRAPDPMDIIWENLQFDQKTIFKRRTISNVIQLIVLILSMGIIYAISLGQESIVKKQLEISKNSSKTKLINYSLSLFVALLLFVINSILGQTMNFLSTYELRQTKTGKYISIAQKLGVTQFINTALVTFFINLQLNGSKMWTYGGLIDDVFIILLSNAIVPPLLIILFDFSYYINLYRKKKILKGSAIYTQREQLNIFAGIQQRPEIKYANIMKTMLMGLFYARALPIGLIFCFINLFLYYWFDKYILLKRSSKPNVMLGSRLSKTMTDFFMEFILVIYSSGCWIFEKMHYNNVSWITKIQFILAIVYWLLPFEDINNYLFKPIQKTKNIETYQDKKMEFLTDYDRTNPITMGKAIEQWMEQKIYITHYCIKQNKVFEIKVERIK